MLQTGTQLHGAVSQGGGNTENGAAQGDDIDEVAGGAVHISLEKGIEGTSNGEWQMVAEPEIGKGQSHGAVNGPGMDAPVEEGVQHGCFGLFTSRKAFPEGEGVVRNGFCHAEI